ncbi:hypothetical protein FHR84_004408 [Actinopolyspora biskrensis]|uniref:Uncharacterized protein n=1 Tax=Actinopolyspora biskrensis TaxID=1470178 RepID=A0A852Z1A8_9ACTN|nr:hypothetical protein [Actinopolyspora biskrensis]
MPWAGRVAFGAFRPGRGRYPRTVDTRCPISRVPAAQPGRLDRESEPAVTGSKRPVPG